MSRHFALERSQIVRASPERVVDQLLDPATWPRWQPEIVSTEGPARVEPGDEVRGRARLLGFHVEGLSTAVEVGPGAFEEDVIVGVRMRVRYEVRAAPEGSLVVHHFSTELPAGLAGRALSLFLRLRLKSMQRKALRGLAAQSELFSSSG